jgi:PAS domain S-box-containing protein
MKLLDRFLSFSRGQKFGKQAFDCIAFERLCKSESLLAEAEQLAGLGSWEHDLMNGEEIWSENLCRMLGVNPANRPFSQEVFWGLVHPDDRELVHNTIEWGMKDRQSYEYQVRFVLPGDRQRIFFVRGNPLLDSDNRVIKRIGVAQDVTASVEAQRALLESEERYRDLVEKSHDLICTHDLRGRILSMNELPAQILGYRREDLIGRLIADCLQAEVRGGFGDYIKRIERDGYAKGLMVLMTRSGERRIWEYQNTLRTEGVPSPIVRGMAHDVTERFNAQKALHDSQARLNALVESIDDVVLELDPEGTVLDIRTTRPELLFRPREEQLGRRVSEIIGPDFFRPFAEIFKRVLASGKSEELEYPLSVGVGERWFVARVTPILAADGTYKSLCLLVRDITERKQAEQKLLKQERLQAQAEELASLGSWEFNVETGEVIWSTQHYRNLGVDPQETPVTADLIGNLAHPEDRERIFLDSKKAITENRPFEHEARYVLFDGRTRFLHTRGLPITNSFGRVVRLVGMSQDITERKQAEEALREKEATVRSLFQMAKMLTGTLKLQAILDLLILQSVKLIGTEGGCSGLRTGEGFSCDSFFEGTVRKEMKFKWPPGVGIPGWVLEHGKTYLTNDASRDPLILPEVREAFGLRSVLCVPVFDIRGEVIAFFALHNKRAGNFEPSDVETVEGISQVTSNAIQNALAYRRIRRAEQDLRRLSARLINSQDAERRRIARDLHEGTMQDLAGLRMSLARVKRILHDLPSPVSEMIDETLELSDKVIQEVRTMSYLLHPPMLDEAGLGLVVSWYASGFSERSGIEVAVEVPANLGRLHRDYETTLFRVMQECLTNVHRHSESKWARVCIVREPLCISMEVQDSGKGMATNFNRMSSSRAQLGVGIAGMHERIKQFHGTFQVDSTLGHGTAVRVTLPIPKNLPRKSCA